MNLSFYLSQLSYKKYLSLLFIIAIFLYVYFQGSYIPHFCLLETLFNIKCSFCDLTKSFEELFKGNFTESLRINFLSYALMLFFILKFIINHSNKINRNTILERGFIFLCLVQLFNANI
jgi:hypothetical protein